MSNDRPGGDPAQVPSFLVCPPSVRVVQLRLLKRWGIGGMLSDCKLSTVAGNPQV